MLGFSDVTLIDQLIGKGTFASHDMYPLGPYIMSAISEGSSETAGSPKPSLVAYLMSIPFIRTGSNLNGLPLETEKTLRSKVINLYYDHLMPTASNRQHLTVYGIPLLAEWICETAFGFEYI